MKFTKMHGCGNDYIYVNLFQEHLDNPSGLAIAVSDRHFGIGGDGLITIGPSVRADFAMHIYNADGSEAEMCGNGIRCVAKYVYDHGMTDKTEITVETGAGIKKLTMETSAGTGTLPAETGTGTDVLSSENGRGLVTKVRVDMGEPVLTPADIPADFPGDRVVNEPLVVEEKEWRVTCVSMGNPHAVVFVPALEHFPLEQVGPKFEHHPLFPRRINTEFVEVLGRKELRMRVWERGSGETLACGTGTCACVMAAILNGYTEDEVLVHLLGGDLVIQYDRETNHLFMTGPATTVFEGELDVTALEHTANV